MSERDELAHLSYLGGFDDPHSQLIRPFDQLPDWEKKWFYRTSDLIISNGYRKVDEEA
jgi:hypothetical protein